MKQTHTNAFYNDFFTHVAVALVEQEALKIREQLNNHNINQTDNHHIIAFFASFKNKMYERYNLRSSLGFETTLLNQRFETTQDAQALLSTLVEECACFLASKCNK